MKIENLKPGQTVYDAHRHTMGNTTMRTMGVWDVRIISVDLEKGIVEYSWNGNEPRKYYGRTVKWRANKPVLVGTISKRLATRAEIKAIKEAKQ